MPGGGLCTRFLKIYGLPSEMNLCSTVPLDASELKTSS